MSVAINIFNRLSSCMSGLEVDILRFLFHNISQLNERHQTNKPAKTILKRRTGRTTRISFFFLLFLNMTIKRADIATIYSQRHDVIGWETSMTVFNLLGCKTLNRCLIHKVGSKFVAHISMLEPIH